MTRMPPNLRDRLALVAAAADGYNPDPDPALWELDRAHYLAMVDAVLADFRSAPISETLKGALAYLEIMTLRPMELSAEHAKAALRAELTAGTLKDAIAVGTLFNIITRYAGALDFAMRSAKEFDRAASMLLKRGYGS